jgi:putative membrane protein insertion efficiency factor
VRIRVLLLAGIWAILATRLGATPDPPSATDRTETTVEGRRILHWTLRAYQKYLSSQDRPACNFAPSCSNFALAALRETNTLRALALTADRLQRCHPLAHRYYPSPAGSVRCSDPLASYIPTATVPDRPGAPGVFPAGLRPIPVDVASNELYLPRALQTFGLFLLQQRDPARAAGEFERAIWTASDPSDTLLYLAGVSLRAGGRPDRARPYLLRILQGRPASRLRPMALWQYAYCTLESDPGLGGTEPRGTDSLECLSADEGREWTLLRSADVAHRAGWHEALRLFRSGNLGSASAGASVLGSDLEVTYERAARGRRRSSLLAGILSAILPGSGKIYAGRTADGVFSLVSIAFFGWQSAHAFDEHGASSAKGWTLAGVTAWFYGGNIYGSTVAARLQNDHDRGLALEGLDSVLERHAPKGLGLDAEKLAHITN